MRPELSPLPERMKHLRVDSRGYPAPWFVPEVNGEPEFRCMDGRRFVEAIKRRLCWVCGQRLGAHLTFVTGPMCLVSGTNAEPPSHWTCATWSARNCPFLSRPHAVRRENDLPEEMTGAAGLPILRNPGAVAVVTVRTYEVFYDDASKPLIKMGLEELEHIEWFFMGEPATRAQVQASIDSGFPILMGAAEQDGPAAIEEVKRRLVSIEKLLPKE